MIHHDSNTVPIFGSKKVIDCFIFFKEIDLLRVRLEYLGDQIDHFIIIEANIDFSGKPKKYYLENHVASLPFAKKIIYHKLEINKFSISTPSFSAYVLSKACSASINAAIPPAF